MSDAAIQGLSKGIVNMALYELENDETDSFGHSLYSISKSVAETLKIEFRDNKFLQREVRLILIHGLDSGAIILGKNRNRYRSAPAKKDKIDIDNESIASTESTHDSDVVLDDEYENEAQIESAAAPVLKINFDNDSNVDMESDSDFVPETDIISDKKEKKIKKENKPKAKQYSAPKTAPKQTPKQQPVIKPHRYQRKPLQFEDTQEVLEKVRCDIIVNLNERPTKTQNKKIRFSCYRLAAGYFRELGYMQYFYKEALPAPVVYAIRTAFP